MHFLNRLSAVFLTVFLAGAILPLDAKTKRGDKFLAEGRVHEAKKEWDAALECYQKALAEDQAELVYQMAVNQARFQDAQWHIERGLKIRANGQLGEALLEFQRASTINPGSSIAQQELALTGQMIERERRRVEDTGRESSAQQRSLTPAQESRRQTQEKIGRMLPVPELKPLSGEPIRDLKINGQPVKVLYETIGKVAGVNVLWDPDFQPPAKNTFNVDFENATLDQALDYISVITKSYWKPLSTNAIFITNDNPNKRRDFEEMVAQTFYLTNVSSAQEIQEIVNAVRSIAELQRVVAFTSQNAIIVRGESDKVALAAKMIHDLDKPRAEVVVDIMVMEASSSFSRQLTAAIASTGLNLPVVFSPRQSLQVQTTNSTTSSTTANTNTTSTNSSATAGGTVGSLIPLNNLGHLSSADFATTLPSALLQAALSDTKTRVLQAPQLRSVDGVKATLKIGEREPTASGSFASTVSSVSPLVSTQFNYIDVGVNVTLLPHVHDNGDISMDVDLEISSVTGTVNLGGLSQPIIGQRKVTHSVRMREGEVSLLAGLAQSSDSKQMTGIPGLSSVPLLKYLFQGQSMSRENDQVMIVLIPHIVRQPSVSAENMRGIAVGSQTAVKLNYAPRPGNVMSGPQAAAALAAQPSANAPANLNRTPAPPAPAPGAPPATAPPPGASGAPPAAPPVPAAAAPGPAGSARVGFSPAQVQTRVGSLVSVAVTLEGGTDVASAPLQIQFDPKILRLNDVLQGGLLASDGQQPVFTKNVMNDNGTATVQLNRQPGTPGVNGSGTLVTLQFQAVAPGSTAVTIPQMSVRNSQGQPVAAAGLQLPVSVQ